MADGALGPHGDVGGAAADVDQADTEILFVFGQHGIAGRQRLQDEVIDLQPATAHALDDVLGRGDSTGDDVRLYFQTHAAHADRLADAVLTIDDELLRQDVQDFLIGRDRHRLGGFDHPFDIAGGDFLVLDRHHAVRVEALDVAAGDAGVHILDLAVGHQLDFLDHPADGVHRLLDINDDALLQAARVLRAHADDIEMALIVDLGDQRDDFRRPDVQPDDQILVVPAHKLTFPSPRPRP